MIQILASSAKSALTIPCTSAVAIAASSNRRDEKLACRWIRTFCHRSHNWRIEATANAGVSRRPADSRRTP